MKVETVIESIDSDGNVISFRLIDDNDIDISFWGNQGTAVEQLSIPAKELKKIADILYSINPLNQV